MPELAEVEFYRRKWHAGVGDRVARVHLHGGKRIFRGIDVDRMTEILTGAVLRTSAAHGKQMLFGFTKQAWLGIHLGMTGELRVEPAAYPPAKHDHLVLYQKKRALVFNDPRLFGRVHFSHEKGPPGWWQALPPRIDAPEFTVALMKERLIRHRSLPLKAALLDQGSFPGIGNWMADEILWQAKLHPRMVAGNLNQAEVRLLWRVTREVAKRSVETISVASDRRDFGDPPKGYLFHVRWKRGGFCPLDGSPLKHETIGGRTTAWCPKCQVKRS
jgi:formamidopyrimidine-DNA glycosylase